MNLRLLTKLPLVALIITERPSIKCKKLPHFSFKDNSNPQNWLIHIFRSVKHATKSFFKLAKKNAAKSQPWSNKCVCVVIH